MSEICEYAMGFPAFAGMSGPEIVYLMQGWDELRDIGELHTLGLPTDTTSSAVNRVYPTAEVSFVKNIHIPAYHGPAFDVRLFG